MFKISIVCTTARSRPAKPTWGFKRSGAGDTHDTHDTHGLQGALFFRVPHQNLSIQVPKTCYARSTLVKKKLWSKNSELVTRELANALRTVPTSNYARTPPHLANSLPSKIVLQFTFYVAPTTQIKFSTLAPGYSVGLCTTVVDCTGVCSVCVHTVLQLY